MTGRRTPYEIAWEILVYCRTPRGFTAIVTRCDLNSKTGQEHIALLLARGFLELRSDAGRTVYVSTPAAAEYIALFGDLYRRLFDGEPGFRL